MILSNIKSKKNRLEVFCKGDIFKVFQSSQGCACVSFLVNLQAGDFYFIEYLWTAA